MKIDVETMKKIVSICWEAAAHAPLEGIGDGMFTEPNEKGEKNFRSPRWTAYERLLSNLLPNVSLATMNAEMTMNEPKEPWQQGNES